MSRIALVDTGERPWAPGGRDFRRIVVSASSGMVTMEAIAWCHAQDIALTIVDEAGEVLLGPGRLRPRGGAPPPCPGHRFRGIGGLG